MRSRVPSPSPRTLLAVGSLRYLLPSADPGGPGGSEGLDNSGDRRAALPLRLRWLAASRSLRGLLLSGHFLGASDAR